MVEHLRAHTVDSTFPDDRVLCAFELAHPSDGRIRLAEERRRGYFQSAPYVNDASRAILVSAGSDIIGMTCWSEVPLMVVDGQCSTVAVVSGLRIHPSYRGRGVFLRGLRELRKTAASSNAKLVVAFILGENEQAASMLLKERRYGARGHSLGEYRTLLIPAAVAHAQRTATSSLRRATIDDSDRVIAFLRRQGAKRPLFPEVTREALFDASTDFRNLTVEDFLLAFRGGELVGCTALWNQESHRRWTVQGYRGLPALVRRLYNFYANACGGIPLPQVGEGLPYIPLSFFCAPPEIAPELLALARAEAHGINPRSILALGLHERDPLLQTLERSAARILRSTMILLDLDGSTPPVRALENEPLYFDIGLL